MHAHMHCLVGPDEHAHLVACPEECHSRAFLVCVQSHGMHEGLLHSTQGVALLVFGHTHIPAIVLAEHDLPRAWELTEQRPSIVHDVWCNCNALRSQMNVTAKMSSQEQ